MAKAKTRQKGRRSAPSAAIEQKHKKSIMEAARKRERLADQLQKANQVLAERIDNGMGVGVQTRVIAGWLRMSRQNVYRMVRELVDGEPLANRNRPSGSNNSKKGT